MRTGTMKPAELERIRGALELSQERLGALFGIAPRTMRRYVAGESEIPLSLAYCLRLMIERKIAPGDLDPGFRD